MVVASASVFKIKSDVFGILVSTKRLFQIMKINNFQGELTDVSAQTEALVVASSSVFQNK